MPNPIPNTKFTNPNSCYSFIANFRTKTIEIYFPKGIKIAQDFQNWLDEHEFTPKENYLYVGKLIKKNQEAITKLLEMAKPNGAYLAEDINNLEDRVAFSKPQQSISSARTSHGLEQSSRPVSSKSKFEALLERHLKSAIEQLTQQNAIAISRYEDRIKELEAVIISQQQEYQQQIDALIEQNSFLTSRVQELQEYEDFFVTETSENQGDSENQSPFSSDMTSPFTEKSTDDGDIDVNEVIFDPADLEEPPEDMTHLSSPFQGSVSEILDPEDYDESGLNNLISPVESESKREENPNGSPQKSSATGSKNSIELSLEDLDLSSIEDENQEDELDQVLDKIEVKFNRNGKG